MTLDKNRRRLIVAATSAGLLGATAGAYADTYPAKPIRLINPFAPGGSADIISRLFAAKLSSILGANMFVDNMGGAGGTIASERVAKSLPDGYTLLLSNIASQAIAPTLYSKLGYDALNDFDHIAFFGSFPNVLVVGPTVKATTVAELIAEAKAHPGTMNFGSAGNGSTPHLSAELFKLRTGIQAQHIPFKGAGPALVAVMAGEITFQFENLSSAIPQIRSGKLRALGVTSAKRIAVLPDVPTMQEAGVPDFVIGAWYGISAPAKTPIDITQTIAQAVTKAINDPSMRSRLEEIGLEPSTIAPAQYREYIASEIKLLAPLIKASGAKVD